MKALSGQKVVTTAGTAVQLSDRDDQVTLMVKALDTNTDIVAIGNDGNGDVTVSNGMRLDAGEVALFPVMVMSSIWIDSVVSGEGVSWLILE